MIIGISKENGDRILENFLVGASKVNGSVECAKESIEIMDKFDDSQLIVSLLVSNSIRSLGQIPERVVDFEVEVLSALTTMFTTCDESDIPAEFEYLFLGTEDEVLEVVSHALGVDKSKLSLASSSMELEEWDSLGHIAIIQDIQNKFEGRYEETGKLASAITVEEIWKILNS